MNEYINLTLENIDEEHICCAIGDKKHQVGVDSKKEWIKNKLKDGHIFRKLNARGKIFIEYEPIETAWVPISGKNYEYIYCLWVAGSFKGKGIGKELLKYLPYENYIYYADCKKIWRYIGCQQRTYFQCGKALYRRLQKRK